MNEYLWETASVATTGSADDCPTPKDDYASRLTRLEEEFRAFKPTFHPTASGSPAISAEEDRALLPLAEETQLAENAWVPPHLRAARESTAPSGYTERKADHGHSITTSLSGESDTVVGKKDGNRVKNKEDTTPITLSPIVQAVEHQPIAGKSFIIRTRQEPRRVLTLTNGKLEFSSMPFPGDGIFWQCVTKEGWYGFQNTASGTYLGHNGQRKIRATQPHHRADEYFTAVRHEDGGYILLMRQHNELLQTAISEDSETLLMQKEAGTAWDFIDTQHVRCSISLAYPNMSMEKLC